MPLSRFIRRFLLKALLGTLALADYKPPEQGYGSKTVSYLNEIVDKLNLTGMPSVSNAKEFAKAAMGQGRFHKMCSLYILECVLCMYNFSLWLRWDRAGANRFSTVR